MNVAYPNNCVFMPFQIEMINLVFTGFYSRVFSMNSHANPHLKAHIRIYRWMRFAMAPQNQHHRTKYSLRLFTYWSEWGRMSKSLIRKLISDLNIQSSIDGAIFYWYRWCLQFSRISYAQKNAPEISAGNVCKYSTSRYVLKPKFFGWEANFLYAL